MPPIDAYITSAVSGLISAATLALATYLVKQVHRIIKDIREIKVSQRNQLKSAIVHTYELTEERGYITPMELETMNRCADSYFELGGNNYVHSLVSRMNKTTPVKGIPIPATIPNTWSINGSFGENDPRI